MKIFWGAFLIYLDVYYYYSYSKLSKFIFQASFLY